MQLREDQLRGLRPACPCGSAGKVHRHGNYTRYVGPEVDLIERIQRYLCPPCGRTFSVLPPHRLPYRAILADRLQGEFDKRAGIQTQELDPTPRDLEAGCLQRAWSVLTERVEVLKHALGQLISSTVCDGVSFWASVRQSFDSVPKLLAFLSEHHRISLLGNYRCLQPAD